MAITRFPPNTIWLGGPRTVINDLAASEAITPGMSIERFNSAGVIRFRKSTRTGLKNSMYATEQSMLNKGVDDAYAANDLVEAIEGAPGTTVWALVASGATITAGQRLTDAGNGYLKAVGSDTPCAEALENITATAVTRIRVEVL